MIEPRTARCQVAVDRGGRAGGQVDGVDAPASSRAGGVPGDWPGTSAIGE
jgi:hypothetical protein